ncbi:hypothetical protein [Maribacter dokdonensis]|uniref:hypothetical protein n=1 Tax=Maribacter dokdonensis TaxID=320912 RepID=UPI00071993C1|nr:hypothetical protein [Maribacter dokdonensis]KSA15311.1 hypothetical protein I600_1924 [Maribacter dokdonensis DSW-8]
MNNNEDDDFKFITSEYINNLDLKLKSNFEYLTENQKNDIKLSDLCTNFIVSYLSLTIDGIGKIDQLILDRNKMKITLDRFMNKQNATYMGYAKITSKTNDCYVLELTESGRIYYRHSDVKYRIKFPTLIQKIKLYILNLTKKLKSLVFVSANNKIKMIMDSGITRLILFILSVITFVILIKNNFFN